MPARPRSKKNPMAVSTIISAFFHAIIILGVTLNPLMTKLREASNTLEITVATHATTPPKQADYLAAVSHQGGGEAEDKVAPTIKNMPQQEAESMQALQLQAMAAPPVTTPNQEVTRAVVTSTAAIPIKAAAKDEKKASETPPQAVSNTPVDQQIASLIAKIDFQQNEIAKRPHRRQVSASTHEARDAQYLEYWRHRIESIGNLNYPSEAKRKQLSGELRLLVAINKDGTINGISVRESSGQAILDDAAVQIVRLAAPFQPLPEEVRKDTDILEIIRTWHFGSDSRLLATR